MKIYRIILTLEKPSGTVSLSMPKGSYSRKELIKELEGYEKEMLEII